MKPQEIKEFRERLLETSLKEIMDEAFFYEVSELEITVRDIKSIMGKHKPFKLFLKNEENYQS